MTQQFPKVNSHYKIRALVQETTERLRHIVYVEAFKAFN